MPCPRGSYCPPSTGATVPQCPPGSFGNTTKVGCAGAHGAYGAPHELRARLYACVCVCHLLLCACLCLYVSFCAAHGYQHVRFLHGGLLLRLSWSSVPYCGVCRGVCVRHGKHDHVRTRVCGLRLRFCERTRAYAATRYGETAMNATQLVCQPGSYCPVRALARSSLAARAGGGECADTCLRAAGIRDTCAVRRWSVRSDSRSSAGGGLLAVYGWALLRDRGAAEPDGVVCCWILLSSRCVGLPWHTRVGDGGGVAAKYVHADRGYWSCADRACVGREWVRPVRVGWPTHASRARAPPAQHRHWWWHLPPRDVLCGGVSRPRGVPRGLVLWIQRRRRVHDLSGWVLVCTGCR